MLQLHGGVGGFAWGVVNALGVLQLSTPCVWSTLCVMPCLQVGSLRAGRFYAVRLRAHGYAELDTGPVFFNDTYTSAVLAFRTVPCAPGQMQAPALARRDRTQLKV